MLVEAEIRINQGPQASQAAKVSQGRGPCRHLASWTSTMDTTWSCPWLDARRWLIRVTDNTGD